MGFGHGHSTTVNFRFRRSAVTIGFVSDSKNVFIFLYRVSMNAQWCLKLIWERIRITPSAIKIGWYLHRKQNSERVSSNLRSLFESRWLVIRVLISPLYVEKLCCDRFVDWALRHTSERWISRRQIHKWSWRKRLHLGGESQSRWASSTLVELFTIGAWRSWNDFGSDSIGRALWTARVIGSSRVLVERSGDVSFSHFRTICWRPWPHKSRRSVKKI